MYYRNAVVWQKAMRLALASYRLTPLLPREEVYGMRSQLTRAAISVPANVAEGWARETNADKAHFLAIAHGSLAELETLLTLCEHLRWFPLEQTMEARALIDETSRMLTTLRRRRRKQK
ncbi:four helix bundle protein [Stenotrophomonas sp. SY1]|uniref:four helix bundle protein n=1 Tax=Stenotrophomonas sp. SY1 TaxID=477235 RepID=UPI001E58B247|nr:four helix bundle protein [Stenotrophomonas sp. SY1]MCD9085547.1 four helix bundle protein [Stenotrophomonas sp. SY1]